MTYFNWKTLVAAVVVVIAVVLTALGYDSFIQGVGYTAAGFLFGKSST